MHEHHVPMRRAIVTIALILACSPAPDVPTATTQASSAHAAHGAASRINNGELTAEQKQAVADVRKATQRFHDIAFATAANGGGYTMQFPAGCAASPDGAQGFHYLNNGLVDVGVDYIVPLALSATPPTLLGVPFAPLGPPLNVWALHIWAWRPNPSGMFAPWNPKVSCEFAQ